MNKTVMKIFKDSIYELLISQKKTRKGEHQIYSLRKSIMACSFSLGLRSGTKIKASSMVS